MSMVCDVCQVTLNSSVQFQQHLSGQGHAKKLKQQQQGDQAQAQTRGHGQSRNQGHGQSRNQGHGQSQNQGRSQFYKQGQGRGRAIRGASGRKRGSPLDLGRGQGRGWGPGGTNSAWLFPLAGPGLEPVLRDAVSVTAAALQVTNLGFGGGQPYGRGPFLGGGHTFGNDQSLGGNDLPFGNPMFGSNQAFRNNPTFDTMQDFGDRMFPGHSRPDWRALKAQKAQRPKQPPPLPKPKPQPPDLREPMVFGDNMGVVSVSMEGENQLFCEVCCVQMTSPDQAYYHYRGAKHIKKARVARLHEVGALVENFHNPAAGHFYCSSCNITVNSADQLQVHRAGARHKKMLEQRKRKSGEQADSEPIQKKFSP